MSSLKYKSLCYFFTCLQFAAMDKSQWTLVLCSVPTVEANIYLIQYLFYYRNNWLLNKWTGRCLSVADMVWQNLKKNGCLSFFIDCCVIV
jgi:hypothetical protein